MSELDNNNNNDDNKGSDPPTPPTLPTPSRTSRPPTTTFRYRGASRARGTIVNRTRGTIPRNRGRSYGCSASDSVAPPTPKYRGWGLRASISSSSSSSDPDTNIANIIN